MYFKNSVFLLFILLLTGLVVAQESVAVFEFNATGIDEQTTKAAMQIFINELNATGKFSVIPTEEMETNLSAKGITDFNCLDVSCAAEYGFALGIENVIIGTYTKLGDKIIAEVKLVSVSQKKVAFMDRFSTVSVEDLDMVLRRLANAVAQRKKIATDVGRFGITEQEAEEPRRKKSFITSGASFSFGFPFGDSYSGVDNIKTFWWNTRYETGDFVVDNSVGISWGTGEKAEVEILPGITQTIAETRIAVIPWDIGVRYIFNREAEFAPFLGGGLGFHFIGSQSYNIGYGAESYEAGHGSDEAMALHIAGGIFGFQSSNFRLTLEGKYTIVFSDAFQNSGSSSQQFGISIGITRELSDSSIGCGCF
jgi:TolB-like protein